MPNDHRDERGRFEPTFSEDDFLVAVREHEPAGTSEVARALGCTTQNADYRLRRLEAAGKVRSKKVGPSLVWMLTEGGEDSGDQNNVGEE